MSNKGKYIGVESRVRYEILEAAISDYLNNGAFEKEKCLSHIKQYTKGENRAGKILKHISVLINKNDGILKKLSKNIDAHWYTQLSVSERKAFIVSLFCNGFPITYDILIGFAQALKVQNIVSKEVIIRKIGSSYGSNRAMHIAVAEILPLLIECGLLVRSKVGIYSKGPNLIIANMLVSETLIYTDIKLSGSKSILFDDLDFRPWYCYFEIMNLTIDKFQLLISKKESAVGKGYLTIKN